MNLKKCIFIIIMIFLFSPLSVFAKEYYPDSNVTMDIDDSTWYVFTRDNISNNSELDDIGVTEDYLKNFMINNDVYLDAIQFDDNDSNNNLELFVRKIKLDKKVGNLHTYNENEINELGTSLLKSDKISADDFEVFGDKYKYIVFEYYDNGFNIYQFYTVINGYGYNFTIQKVNSITSYDRVIAKSIIYSATFDVDPNYEKAIDFNNSNSSIWENALSRGLTGGIAAAIIGGLSVLFTKNKNKNTNLKVKKTNSKQKYTYCDNCGCKVVEELTACPKCKKDLRSDK